MQQKAFTLIELLVVVLIIGILAAVAVPQYEMAVEKSRLSLSKQMSRIVAEAAERYYLANGKYSSNFDELDVSLPGTYTTPTANTRKYSWGRCGIYTDNVFCHTEKALTAYQIYFQYGDGHWLPGGSKVCVAYSTDLNDIGNKLCKKETQQSEFRFLSHNNGYYNNGYVEWLYPTKS